MPFSGSGDGTLPRGERRLPVEHPGVAEPGDQDGTLPPGACLVPTDLTEGIPAPVPPCPVGDWLDGTLAPGARGPAPDPAGATLAPGALRAPAQLPDGTLAPGAPSANAPQALADETLAPTRRPSADLPDGTLVPNALRPLASPASGRPPAAQQAPPDPLDATLAPGVFRPPAVPDGTLPPGRPVSAPGKGANGQPSGLPAKKGTNGKLAARQEALPDVTLAGPPPAAAPVAPSKRVPPPAPTGPASARPSSTAQRPASPASAPDEQLQTQAFAGGAAEAPAPRSPAPRSPGSPFVGPVSANGPAAFGATLVGKIGQASADGSEATSAHLPNQFLDFSGPSQQPTPAGPAFVPPPIELIDDKYEILAVLGRGGMGVVYKARQVLLHRLVAIKMILAGRHASAEEKDRFLLEAQAAAGLQHPNIVQIYEIGEHEDKPYISLEFIEGDSLYQRIAGKPWEAREAARLVETLSLAMHHAHLQGIIHRDLKPANVLLTGAGQPKITDFGLAKRLDSANEGHTGANDILGTPAYMAPEQAMGKNREIGPGADIYALGVILYELIVGRVPFRGETPLETIQLVQQNEPEVPPTSVPIDLSTICLKCLQKDPRKRYPSASDLADDLRRFLEGRPILARPIPWYERAWKWACRRPTAAALLVMSVLGPLLLLTVSVGFIIRLEAALRTATLAEQEARTQSERADEERLEAQNQRNEADTQRLEAKKKEQEAVEEKKSAEFAFRQAQKAVEALLQGASNRGSRQETGALPIRNELVRRALGVVQDLTKVRPTPAARAQFAWANRMAGDLSGRLGERKASMDHYDQSIRTYQELLREEQSPEDRAKVQVALAETFLGRWYVLWDSDPNRAAPDLDQALRELKRMPADKVAEPTSILLRVQLLSSRATHWWAQGNLEQAKADYREALEELKHLPIDQLSRTASPETGQANAQQVLYEDCELERARVETNLGMLLTWTSLSARPALPKGLSPQQEREELAQRREADVRLKEEADGYHEEAIRRLSKLVEQNPREPTFARELSRAYLNQGTWWGSPFEDGRARQASQPPPAVKVAMPRKEEEGLRARNDAVDQHVRDRYGEAVTLFNRLAKENRYAPDYRHLLGLVYLGQGEYHLAQGDLAGAEKPLKDAYEELRGLARWFRAEPGHQLDLARACNSLGLFYLDRAQRKKNTPLESWDLLARGQALLKEGWQDWLEPLRVEFPRNTRVRQSLDMVCNNLLLSYHRQIELVELMNARGAGTAAGKAEERRQWQRVERCVEELAAFRRNRVKEVDRAQVEEARGDLGSTLLTQADLLYRMGKPEETAEPFEEIARVVPSGWTNYPRALRLLAGCVARALGPDDSLADLNQQAINRLGRAAVRLLERAGQQKGGNPVLVQALQGKDFEPLRRRPELAAAFLPAVRKLEAKSPDGAR